MAIFAKFFGKKKIITDEMPTISFIIAAYNEQEVIKEKLKNVLKSDYPQELIEIIVAADGSNDNTTMIASDFLVNNMTILHDPIRRGKTHALNRAVTYAKNEIIVFSDANSFFEPDALNKLVRNFANTTIGGVCGRKCIISNEQRSASAGDNTYWKFESWLKSNESLLGSIPTADGEIFAIRRSIWLPIPPKIINDDTAITLNILSQNYKVIYESEAICLEQASHNLKDDFYVKARMVYGGFQILHEYFPQLNPLQSVFGLQFFIHKILRYLMWYLLLCIFTINSLLIHEDKFYFMFFWFQCLFYLLAMIGSILDRNKIKVNLFYYPYYYCAVNLAALKGLIYFIRNQSQVAIWKKAQR